MTPYADLLARTAHEGLVCCVCGSPTENVHTPADGTQRAYPCGPACTAELRRAIRASIHARCCGRTEPAFCKPRIPKAPSLGRFVRAYGDTATDGNDPPAQTNQRLVDRIAGLEQEVDRLRRRTRPHTPQRSSATRNEPPPPDAGPVPVTRSSPRVKAMNDPEIKSVGSVHKLYFGEYNLTIDVDRIHEGSRNETSGEMTIKSLEKYTDGFDGFIFQGRQNLLSARSRTETARRLKEMYPAAVVPWDGVLERACKVVLQAHRSGEPTMWVDDMPAPEMLRYRVKPFLHEQDATLIFGDGDTGKSWFAMLLAYLTTTGRSAYGLDVEPGRVLYLDYETNKESFWERMNAISSGLNEALPHIAYRRMSQYLSMDVIHLSRVVRDEGIDVVIVDSATPAVGEAESSTAVAHYFHSLRAMDVTSLTIAHLNKTTRENAAATAAFGSIFWRNLPRANWRADADHVVGASSLIATFRNTKSNGSRRHPDVTLRLDFEGDDPAHTVKFRKADAADVPDWSERRSLSE